MLNAKEAVATIAVKDIEVARKFYQDVVGLTPLPSTEPDAVPFKSGNSSVLVYESQYAGTNQATAVTWQVEDVEDTVRALRAKGITFEHYDMPEVTRKGDVHVAGDIKVAWFKDPDGNILNVINR